MFVDANGLDKFYKGHVLKMANGWKSRLYLTNMGNKRQYIPNFLGRGDIGSQRHVLGMCGDYTKIQGTSRGMLGHQHRGPLHLNEIKK